MFLSSIVTFNSSEADYNSNIFWLQHPIAQGLIPPLRTCQNATKLLLTMVSMWATARSITAGVSTGIFCLEWVHFNIICSIYAWELVMRLLGYDDHNKTMRVYVPCVATIELLIRPLAAKFGQFSREFVAVYKVRMVRVILHYYDHNRCEF